MKQKPQTTNCKLQAKRGFTLLELLIYSALGLLLLLAVAFAVFRMYDIYREVTTGPRADRVGTSIVDSVVKNVRSGKSIDFVNSVFSDPNGSLTVNSKVNGVAVEKAFGISGGRATYTEDGGSAQYLSPTDITVSKLQFEDISTTISSAVRVDVEITFSTKAGQEVRSYQGVSILRHSYD
jgi:Tfp pilus assembly protein FimT